MPYSIDNDEPQVKQVKQGLQRRTMNSAVGTGVVLPYAVRGSKKNPDATADPPTSSSNKERGKKRLFVRTISRCSEIGLEDAESINYSICSYKYTFLAALLQGMVCHTQKTAVCLYQTKVQ